jgi:hypothetical protein
MKKKVQTRLEKSSAIMKGAKKSKWCYVNIDNEFEFEGATLYIHESVEEYKVHNKAFEVEDYTNEAYMEEILVVVDANNLVTFYNQNYDRVKSVFVKTEA